MLTSGVTPCRGDVNGDGARPLCRRAAHSRTYLKPVGILFISRRRKVGRLLQRRARYQTLDMVTAALLWLRTAVRRW